MEWAGLSALFKPIATRIANYGTEHYSERTARRLRQTNVFNGIVIFLYGLFAAFYALLDWQVLRPLVIAILATMPLFVIPPLLHRVNDYAAMVSIAVINGTALFYAYMVGSAAGLHFFLFAAPAAIVFFGPHHVRIAAFISVCILIAFLFVELFFPLHTVDRAGFTARAQ